MYCYSESTDPVLGGLSRSCYSLSGSLLIALVHNVGLAGATTRLLWRAPPAGFYYFAWQIW